MIGDQVRNHVLLINVEDTDPLILGPYTERKADELADAFNARVTAGALPGDQFGWVYATSRRIDNPQSVRAIMDEFGVTA